MRHLLPISCTRLCTIAVDVSTPDSVHCFHRSPKVWNRSFSTISLRVWSPLLVVQRFLPHFSLPTDFPLRCLDTALWEQPIRSGTSFCVLSSCLRVSIMAFWTAVRLAVLPLIAILSNEPGWEFLKLRCCRHRDKNSLLTVGVGGWCRRPFICFSLYVTCKVLGLITDVNKSHFCFERIWTVWNPVYITPHVETQFFLKRQPVVVPTNRELATTRCLELTRLFRWLG